MFQIKKRDKIPKEELSKVDIRDLPNKEFKVMITKMIKEMRRKNEYSGKFNKNIRIYKEQTKLKNTKNEFF